MRGKPGHRTAPSLEWREKMPRSERRDRKTCLCWKAFTLTHLYKDIKKNPSTIRAGGREGEGRGKERQTAKPSCQLSSCCVWEVLSWPSGWPSSIRPTYPAIRVGNQSTLTIRDSLLLHSHSVLIAHSELFLTGSCGQPFICSVSVTIAFVHHNLCTCCPSACGPHAPWGQASVSCPRVL